ncbi:MAG: VCBS repeat-containing protein [Verrucomicrobia bacterium]|nr:VCBS repeat-containing protein [Verrucomicrobiota bacterium]
MKMPLSRLRQRLLLLALLAATLLPRPAAALTETNRPLFGFRGPEIFPIDPAIAHLRAGDLDGDGFLDLVVANNARAKINLLYNQTAQTNRPPHPKPRKLETNELPPDARFRIESIASEKRIASLVLADLNNDRWPDLAYCGDPGELVVLHNEKGRNWSTPKRWPLNDGQILPDALTAGDLNGDHLADLLLLGETAIHAFLQQPDHALGEPEKIPFAGSVKSAQVLDLNGDARQDLLLVSGNHPYPFRFRLQNDAGSLGPEFHFPLPPVRAYRADDLDGDHRAELVTIALHSGRVQIGNFAPKAAERLTGDLSRGQFQVLPLNKTGKSRRGIAWADLNGDQLPDVVAAEPDSGQLTVCLQQTHGVLSAPRTFPSLAGVSQIAVETAQPGSPARIYLLSPEERQVAVTRFDALGHLPFPAAIPLEGKPLALAVTAGLPTTPSTLAVLVDRDGERHLVVRDPRGKSRSQKLSVAFKSNPARVVWHDVNQDGLDDLVVLIPFEKIKLLLQTNRLHFDELDVPPPGGSLEQPWLSAADVDGDGLPELLLAQKNFLRAVVLPRHSASNPPPATFTVKDQINGADGNSRIVGAAPLPCDGQPIPLLFLLDAERKSLTLCRRDTNALWQIVRNIQLPMTDFDQLQPVALAQTTPNSVAFLGPNALAWMSLAGDAWQFAELDGYETPIRDARLNDIVSGDLNGDDRKDLVFLETAQNHLDLVIFNHTKHLVPATRWRVFEERSFRTRRDPQTEPREALVADVTGDRKNDLIVIAHDRILLYSQE